MRPIVLMALFGLLGCGTGSAPGEGVAELGAGEWRFEPLADGQEVSLVAGAQGGHHVWASVRVTGLDPEGVELRLVTELADGSRAPEESRVRTDLVPRTNGEGHEIVGWPAILSEPGCAVDRMLRVRIVLTDRRGVHAEDERDVWVRAGPIAPPPCP